MAGETILREPVVAVLPAGHPLASRVGLKLRHLADEPFVLFPRRLGEAFYDLVISFCEHAGFSPRVVQEATQWQSVVTFVETGLGSFARPRLRAKVPLAGRGLPGASRLEHSGDCVSSTRKAVSGGFCISEDSARGV